MLTFLGAGVFSSIWLLFYSVGFFSQFSHYSSQTSDILSQNFFYIIIKMHPPYFQSLLIIISWKLTTFPSNKNKTSSAISHQLKCLFSKLSDENITHICKREWGCGIRQFNMSAFSFVFWIQYCRSSTALHCSILPKTHRSSALISPVLALYWFNSMQA